MTLQQSFEVILNEGKKAFIPYIMAGDGGLANLPSDIRRLEQLGATAIEVGIPFTDPVADGPVIEQAGIRALKNGTTLKKVIQTLNDAKEEYSIPLVLMTYLNPILAYGADQFALDANKAGVKGIIVPDMPLEEKDIIYPYLKANNIALIQLISLTSDSERIQTLAKASEGFIYAVTTNGVTGERSSFAKQLPEHIKAIQAVSNVPILAGFGISTPEQVKYFKEICDGVIVGSKIVQSIHENNWDVIEDLIEAIH